MNEPQLSAEMKAKFDDLVENKLFQGKDAEGYLDVYEYIEDDLPKLEQFIATALDEQATRHAMLMAGLEAQIEQKAVIRASELVDKARATALEEQKAEYVRKVETIKLRPRMRTSVNAYNKAIDDVLAILNGKE